MAENDAPVPDKNDYTEHYNTELSPPEQDSFNGWMKDQSAKAGRDVSTDLYDYDLQGYWQKNVGDTEEGPQLSGGPPETRAHLTDEFKKPNHPTFSTGSIYHGVAGNEGGTWNPLDDEHYSFKPGATNLEHRSPEELQDYWERSGEGAHGHQLLLPEAPAGNTLKQPDWAHAGDPRYSVAEGGTGGVPAPPPQADYGAPGQIDRSRIRSELEQNPALADRLNQMVRGEVGDHASPEVRRIARALARAGLVGYEHGRQPRILSAPIVHPWRLRQGHLRRGS